MRKKLLDFMQGRYGILWCMAVLLSGMFPAKALLAGQEQVDCPPLAGVQGVDKCSLSETHPTEICKLLTNKTASEKAQIKSCEIAKRDFKGEYTNTQYGVKVEIIGEVKEINVNGQSGIELFAKAWRGDKQLGFGKDGSVEIERFRIYNPPILVDDPNGTITREWTDKETGLLKQRKLREDPAETIRQVIAHNVTLVGKENTNIVARKVGNTTDTFYPDAHPESTSFDGIVNKDDNDWNICRNATVGAEINDNTANNTWVAAEYITDNLVLGPFYRMNRVFFLFDTSSIPDTDTIDSAIMSVFNLDNNGDNDPIGIVQSSPASNTALTVDDYDQAGAINNAIEGATRASSFVNNTYIDFTLNNTGKGWISKIGISKFALRMARDLDNTIPSARSYRKIQTSEAAGTTQDPKLVVVHSAPTPTPTPSPTPIQTDTTVIQPGSEGKDTCYGTVYATSGQPDAETLYMGGWGDWYYDFFEFDLTGSPSADETISATLYLYGSAPSDGSDPGFQVNRITQSWTESGVTLSNNPSSVFYKNFGSFSKADAWNSVDITDLYKSWKNGTYPNYGIKLVPTNNNHSNGSIYSSDNTNSSYRPKIVVSKSSSGTPTPTPSSSPTPTPTPTDTTAPSGSVSINSGAAYTNSTAVTLTLTATDSVGVVGYYASTSSSTPTASASGWNTVTSTTSYTGSVSYTLTSGDEQKTVYVWYKDAAGNVSSQASDSITLDTTVPIVTITSPTSSDTYTATSSTINLGGSASDSTSGVKEVTWSNDKGGSGTASGTISWTVSSISLSTGDNVITVTAKDGAGNSGTDTITVIVPASTPTPSPTPTPATTPVPTPTIAEKGAIVGTVADEVAGVGITGAKITTDKGGYSATTGFDGTYAIVDVSAGNYTLTASADGYKSSSQAVTVYAGEASAADFILTRESGGIVFGFVHDEKGDLLNGVTVTITGRGNNQLQGTETDDNGYYEFNSLEAGGYTLIFEKSGYTTQTLDITLTSEESLEAETITMELEVKGSIFGYVVDIDGNPIESVKLKLKGIKTKINRNASSDADGFFEFADLEKDKYVIFASKKRYKKEKQTVSLDEGDDQEIEIEMRKSSSSRKVIPEAEE